MSRAIRLLKAEQELLTDLLNAADSLTKAHQKAKESLLIKMAESSKPLEKKSGLTVKDALNVFSGVLRGRLILPPPNASALWAQMQQRIRLLGLTPLDCTIIAKQAASEWTGQIKAQSLINQAESLLQNAQGKLFEDEVTKPKPKPGPVEMDDF